MCVCVCGCVLRHNYAIKVLSLCVACALRTGLLECVCVCVRAQGHVTHTRAHTQTHKHTLDHPLALWPLLCASACHTPKHTYRKILRRASFLSRAVASRSASASVWILEFRRSRRTKEEFLTRHSAKAFMPAPPTCRGTERKRERVCASACAYVCVCVCA